MGFGNATEQRMNELYRQTKNVKKIIIDVTRAATEIAVQSAAELTPPRDGIQGTNTIAGEMKQHWVTDSVIEPLVTNNSVTTALANNMTYASYVNDGHRMDKHFVPGLILNPFNGMLEMGDREVNGKLVGMVVGKKTKYVRGIYMKETAIARYRGHVERELDRRIWENFK